MFPFMSMKMVYECDTDLISGSNEQILTDIIRFNALCAYYARISTANKMKLLDSFVQKIPNIDTLSFLMNLIISPTLFYRKVVRSQVDAINYDRILQDHDRMFTDEKLEAYSAESDVDWFHQLAEESQHSVLIALSRCAGAGGVANLYKSLSEEYSQRKKQLVIIKQVSIDEEKEIPKKEEDERNSVYLECERLQNEYKSLIVQYRKKIFGAPKKPKKVSKKSKKSKSLKSKAKKLKKTKKSKKNKKERKIDPSEEFDIEMIHLMPIWIIKKIMSYLDAKTLSSVKKIDSYWKWVVDDYLKDVKMRKKLNEIHANLLSTLDKNYDDEQSSLLMEEEPVRKTFHDRKMESLCQRGAILEKLRHTKRPLAEFSILYDVLLENKDYEVNAKLNSPRLRVARDHIPLYTKPKILYKDVGLFDFQSDVFTDDSINDTLDIDLPDVAESLHSNCTCNGSLNESLGIIQ